MASKKKKVVLDQEDDNDTNIDDEKVGTVTVKPKATKPAIVAKRAVPVLKDDDDDDDNDDADEKDRFQPPRVLKAPKVVKAAASIKPAAKKPPVKTAQTDDVEEDEAVVKKPTKPTLAKKPLTGNNDDDEEEPVLKKGHVKPTIVKKPLDDDMEDEPLVKKPAKSPLGKKPILKAGDDKQDKQDRKKKPMQDSDDGAVLGTARAATAAVVLANKNKKKEDMKDVAFFSLNGGMLHEQPEYYTVVSDDAEYKKLNADDPDVYFEFVVVIDADLVNPVGPLRPWRFQHLKMGCGRCLPRGSKEEAFLAAQLRRDARFPKATRQKKTEEDEDDTDAKDIKSSKKTKPSKPPTAASLYKQYMSGDQYCEVIDKTGRTYPITLDTYNKVLDYIYELQLLKNRFFDDFPAFIQWKPVRRGPRDRYSFIEPILKPFASLTEQELAHTGPSSVSLADDTDSGPTLKKAHVEVKLTPVKPAFVKATDSGSSLHGAKTKSVVPAVVVKQPVSAAAHADTGEDVD